VLPSPATGFRSPQLRIAQNALAELDLADVESLAAVDGGRRGGLGELLGKLGRLVPSLSDSLSSSFLSHAVVSRNLSGEEAGRHAPTPRPIDPGEP
jgi:hypothetical protein